MALLNLNVYRVFIKDEKKWHFHSWSNILVIMLNTSAMHIHVWTDVSWTLPKQRSKCESCFLSREWSPPRYHILSQDSPSHVVYYYNINRLDVDLINRIQMYMYMNWDSMTISTQWILNWDRFWRPFGLPWKCWLCPSLCVWHWPDGLPTVTTSWQEDITIGSSSQLQLPDIWKRFVLSQMVRGRIIFHSPKTMFYVLLKINISQLTTFKIYIFWDPWLLKH